MKPNGMMDSWTVSCLDFPITSLLESSSGNREVYSGRLSAAKPPGIAGMDIKRTSLALAKGAPMGLVAGKAGFLLFARLPVT